ncbi:MAG: hypothetical protein Q9174_003731 [Haloplaca sp. 1 TL-2023]
MSQYRQGENKAASRSDYSANLATKFDPAMLASKISPAIGSSSTAASQPSTPTPPGNPFRRAGYPPPSSTASSQASRKPFSEMTRQERILDVLGVPEANRPKKDSQPPSNASTARAPTSTATRTASAGQRLQTIRPSAKPATAGSASRTAPFPCPYPECKRGFQGLGDLRIHKENEHDYCRTCDVDCEDFDGLHQHKIMSDRHICCTVCSMDFRSESGRDRHYIQMHGSAHNITCKKCGEAFAKGAAFLLHFEKNMCRPKTERGLNAGLFEQDRAEMAMVMQNRNKQIEMPGEAGFLQSMAPASTWHGSAATSTVGGGVPVDVSEQPDFLTSDEYENNDAEQWPSLSRGTVSEAGTVRPHSPTESYASTNLLPPSERDFPVLNATNLATLNKKTKGDDRTPKPSIMDWPDVSVTKGKGKGKEREVDDEVLEGMSNMSMNMSAKLFPGAPPTPVQGGWDAAPPSINPSRSGFTDIGNPNKAINLQPNALTGQWECPYYKCGRKFGFRQDLETHFADRDNGHRGYEHNCPSCLRRFGTASALMAHLESPTIRCKVRESKGYSNVLHVVSGGHLTTDGVHVDGSHRVVAPEKEAEKAGFIW